MGTGEEMSNNIDMLVLLHEQLIEYSDKLKIVEKELIRKYKAKEDYQKELNEAQGLKALQKETVLMMGQYR